MLSVSKLYFVVALLLGATLQVHSHAIITPALGVTGTAARSDVQRPSTKNECGNVNVASTLDTAQAVTADASGNFAATVTNFNAGTDGSTQVTALVDATGTGKSFVAATVTKNGVKSPTTVGSAQIAVSLPAGTKCTGGTAGNLCLVSFTTAGGFGNCVAVAQDAATAAAGTVAAGTAATGAAATAAAGTATTGTAAAGAKKHKHKQGAAAAAQANAAKTAKGARAYGARLARAFRHATEDWA